MPSNAKERADRVADLIQPFVGARIVDVARSTAASNLQAEGVGLVVEDAHRQRHVIWIDQDADGTGPGSIQVQPIARKEGNNLGTSLERQIEFTVESYNTRRQAAAI